MNDSKYLFIFLSILVIGFFSQSLFSSFGYKKTAVEKGLEECPADPNIAYNSKTIFVKSCSEYITEYLKNHPEK